ncbi:ABC transporter permease [Roseibium sp.]|uniref:ABC transporter permease n=1 Tax=Roseibium sp. TaxID=1936156 RepID=UPI003A97B4BE
MTDIAPTATPLAAQVAMPVPAKGFGSHLVYVLRDNPVTLLAFCMLFLLLFAGIFGPIIAPYSPTASNAAIALQPPSWDHWFGTDNLGRDVFSRVLVATRLDLVISVAAVSLSFVIGSALGAIAGYWGGWIDTVLNRIFDTIMAFPLFVLAMGIVAALGNTVENIVYATAVINIPFYARLVRAEVNIRRDAGFTQAAKLAGNSDLRVLAFHIYPNALPPMMVQVSLNLGWAILNAAGLSFIGLGVRPPTAEWGIMVAEGANFIVSGEWWLAIFPGLSLMFAVFTFNLLGDGLRDLVDPRQRT